MKSVLRVPETFSAHFNLLIKITFYEPYFIFMGFFLYFLSVFNVEHNGDFENKEFIEKHM